MSSTFYKENDDILERFELVSERISSISQEHDLPENLQKYFVQVVEFVNSVYGYQLENKYKDIYCKKDFQQEK